MAEVGLSDKIATMANPDVYKYDVAIAELSQWYDVARENKDRKQFYIYLYEYIKRIDDDKQLMSVVMKLWIRDIANSSPDDERLQTYHMPSQLAVKNKGKLTDVQELVVHQDMQHAVAAARIKETQFTYCWYMLYDSYYKIYRRKLPADSMAKITRIDPKSLNNIPDEKKALVAEAQTIYAFEDVPEAKKAEIEKLNQSVYNFKPSEGQTVYVTCLSLLHNKLVAQLRNEPEVIHQPKPTVLVSERVIHDVAPKPTIQAKVQPQTNDKSNASAPVTNEANDKAELIFHGLTTPTVRYRGYEYIFESLDQNYDPWKIVSYCWTYRLGKEVSLDKLKDEADVSAPKGIKEALRKSPLFMKTKKKKGALSPFIKGLSKEYITVLKNTPLTSNELKIIENTAIDTTKI